MYDIVIIGAGPAGLTAAIYGARASKKVLVLEALNYGGLIINTLKIDNYPVNPGISGYEFATKLYEQVKSLGVEIKFEKAIKIIENEVITDKNTYKTKTVIIATGTNSRKLNLEGEDFLLGKGVSYCATCDGAFYKNKDVAIVGGGNTAIDDALLLSDLAKNVYLIHRRNVFTADDSLLKKIKEKSNIKTILNSHITKLNYNERLQSIDISTNGSISNLKIDGLFIAIGRIPEISNFTNLELENGYIKAKEDCHTNIPSIFVAGDIRTKNLRQLVTATSDGAVAATEAIKYINEIK